MSEITDRVDLAVSGFDARVVAAPADAWGNQSPCTDWKARDVVAHVANFHLNVAAAIDGTEAVVVDPDEDIVAAWGRAKGALSNSMANGDLTKAVPSPFGPMPAADVLGRLVTTDTLVHTWDLARAVGGDEALHPGLVEGAYSGLKPMDAMIRQPGVFDAKVEPPAGADVQTEFLSFLGRSV